MPMLKLGETASPTPFHSFVCTGCGKTLGKHVLYRPEKFADVRPGDKNGRAPNGKLYCRPDQTGYAGSYYQRQLRRTLADGYESRIPKSMAS